MAERYGSLRAFEHSTLFLCESDSDVAFVRAALTSRQKTTGYHVRSTRFFNRAAERYDGGGIEHIGRALYNFRSFSGFARLRHIIIVIDNDDSPQDNFEKVKDQLAEISDSGTPAIAIPDEPHHRKHIARGIDVTVLTIPSQGVPGTLERLLLPAARSANELISTSLDQYVVATQVDGWDRESKKDKMKLRCLLAASHSNNPEIGIGKIWIDAPQLVPLGHASLQQAIEAISAQV